MKIFHLTVAHKRYDSRIFKKECISLATKYNQVQLITLDGKGNEEKNGVQIVDLNDGKLPKNRIKKALAITGKINRVLKKEKKAVVHLHEPEQLICGVFAKLRGQKVVYDIHENFFEQIKIRTWIPKLIRVPIAYIYKWSEMLLCRWFDAVSVPQPRMAAYFEKFNKNTYLVANFADRRTFTADATVKNKVSKVLYVGSLTEERGILTLLDSLDHLNFPLTIIGPFANKGIEDKIRAHSNWTKVDYKGFIPMEDIVAYYQGDYIGVIPFKNIGQYYYTLMIKLFEYMYYGLPIVMPNFGDWPKFNEENNCGITLNTEDPKALAEGIATLLNSEVGTYSQNGIDNVLQKYTWDKAEKELFSLYSSISDAYAVNN